MELVLYNHYENQNLYNMIINIQDSICELAKFLNDDGFSNTSTTDLKVNVHPEAAFIANSVARSAFLGSANVVAWSGNTSSITTSGGWAIDSALVANPVGHIAINIGGTNYKIPYFS